MTEVDVTLSDFAIALECIAFVTLLLRKPPSTSRTAWLLVFAGTALGAIAGGIVHGYCSDASTLGHRLFWPLSLAGVVLAALGLAQVALGRLDLAPDRKRVALRALLLVAAAFGVAILSGRRSFLLAVAAFAPASLLFAGVLASQALRSRALHDALGVAGALLIVLAGVLQQAGYTPWPDLITHNAFFHLVQMVALALVFQASRSPASDQGDVHV